MPSVSLSLKMICIALMICNTSLQALLSFPDFKPDFNIKVHNQQGYSMKMKVGCEKSYYIVKPQKGDPMKWKRYLYSETRWKGKKDITNGLTKKVSFNKNTCKKLHMRFKFNSGSDWKDLFIAGNPVEVEENKGSETFEYAQSSIGCDHFTYGTHVTVIPRADSGDKFVDTNMCFKIHSSEDYDGCLTFDIFKASDNNNCPAATGAHIDLMNIVDDINDNGISSNVVSLFGIIGGILSVIIIGLMYGIHNVKQNM